MAILSEDEIKKALSERIGEELSNKFYNSTVALCGLGGLGSNIAISLVRAGIGKLILIDFDRVELSNINRQQYKISQIGQYKTDALKKNLLEIFPCADIEKHCTYINENNYTELLSEADIICEAFDNAEEKTRLVNFVIENMPGKYIVAASGMAGLNPPNDIKTRKITSHFYICGDGKSTTEKGDTLYSARVAICAAHQALTVLRIIAEKN